MTTVAGSGSTTTGSYNGDEIPATSATLSSPGAVVGDNKGNLFIADTANNRIRNVDAAGIIHAVAGEHVRMSWKICGVIQNTTIFTFTRLDRMQFW